MVLVGLILMVISIGVFVNENNTYVSEKEIQNEMSYDEKTIDNFENTVIEIKDLNEAEENVIRKYFLLADDCSEEAVLAHANYYIEKIKDENDILYGAVLKYYDDNIYYEFGDTTVATVRWARNGRLVPDDDWDGSYSEYAIDNIYQPLNLEYELTEKEKELYIKLQTYAKQAVNAYVPDFTDLSWAKWNDIYQAVAEMNQVTPQEMVLIREKAVFRRYRDETASYN